MADNDLDILDPPGRSVTIAGQSITVKPLTIGQLPRFVRAIQPAAPLLAGNQDIDWLALVAEHGDSLIEAAAVATGMKPGDLGLLPPDEFVILCGAIFEKNVDFFIKRLAPAMERVSDRIVAATATIEAGAGAIHSKLS